MNTLQTIFYKPVDRPIEGVIKADDEASLRLEIEEYVLTNEVEKRLESFLDAYNNFEGANGVWVSGFFGSGKSHLLKILALLLEDRQIDGASAIELFLPKCGDNEILRGDLKRAVAIPSKSILFNIDQKADVISKTQVDALLAVFVKVFDEMCGYYGKQGHIAEFERDLDSRGLYQKFTNAYAATSGRSWQEGREQALLESKNIAAAYAQATGEEQASAIGILDKYRSQYRVSIEDFAEKVHAYVQRQGPNFRLNFFVDEVGQYIAENVKLMTNLQTIAESLATKCRGRAWVIVTAQEEMAAVVGEMGRQQGNDFSKIQARFANRMQLTSADVAEVIQKRLLLKNDDGVQLLTDMYHAQANNFKTLFDFADGSQTYRNFQDRDHFIHSYPFIPYQFALFQAAIQNLSLHNAFTGKHSSVGERSMLGVFQEVAMQISGQPLGRLATFDLMFGGIRTALKSGIQRAIIQAENHLDAPFALRLLKALFLVKYVKEFKPTLRNLCVLMLESFQQNQPQLRKDVEEALNLLEQQTYIQRHGELYQYLTDDEKDVEEEIKNTEVESTEVAAELEKIIFENVIRLRKIRYEENGQDYPYSRKLDDRLHGREYELTINVITPFHEHADKEEMHRTDTVFRHELRVVVPQDDRLIRDILMYKRTEKYIRQNVTVTQQDTVKRILSDKGEQNRERLADLQRRVQSLLGRAKLFVSGSALDIGGEDAQTRVIRGFHELVVRAYPNLRMLRKVEYKEEQIKTILTTKQGTLDGFRELSEAEQEILAVIQSNNRGGVRTTLKSLLEKFERKPYGWNYPAILCLLAHLCAAGKVDVRVDGNLLEEEELERALRNTHGQGNTVLEPQLDFSPSQVRALKEFYEEFFHSPPGVNEAKALGKEIGRAFEELHRELSALLTECARYPFLSNLTPVLETLAETKGKPYTWYLTELLRQEDQYLDMREKVIDPIRRFMGGPQRDIYDNAVKFLQAQEPNFSYLPKGNHDSHPATLQSILAEPDCYKGDRMQQLKTGLDVLQQQVATQLAAEVAKARETLALLHQRFSGMAEFTALNKDHQQQLLKPFTDLDAYVGRQSLIAVIRDSIRRFEETDYQRLFEKMIAWATPPKKDPKVKVYPPGKGSTDQGRQETAEKMPKYINSRDLRVVFARPWLADESDVDHYLRTMREAFLAEIAKGKRIQI